jgi:hypothetical protein
LGSAFWLKQAWTGEPPVGGLSLNGTNATNATNLTGCEQFLTANNTFGNETVDGTPGGNLTNSSLLYQNCSSYLNGTNATGLNGTNATGLNGTNATGPAPAPAPAPVGLQKLN